LDLGFFFLRGQEITHPRLIYASTRYILQLQFCSEMKKTVNSLPLGIVILFTRLMLNTFRESRKKTEFVTPVFVYRFSSIKRQVVQQ